ncbi:MAG: GNAT family N-acetyltransferase [Ferruginibacter sp.]
MKETSINIEKVNFSQLDELMEISIETFYQSFISGNTEENMKDYMDRFFSSAKLTEELSDPGSSFYLARQGRNCIGYLKLNTGQSQTDMKEADSLEIERIYVRNKWQGQGVGQKLFEKALAFAKESGSKYMWLGVWEKNTSAIKFYERNGMVKFSSHKFKLGEDLQTDILMKLNIVNDGAKVSFCDL